MLIKSSRLSRYKIKKLCRYFCADITAQHTAYLTGINRNTVNRFYKEFRILICRMRTADKIKFFGVVELDEAFFGSKRLRGVNMPQKRGRGTWKQPVFGIFERDGRVYTEMVDDASAKTLRKVIKGHVSLQSVVITDGWRGYNGLVDMGYDRHLRINKSVYFSDGNGVHINGIESFWSFTKRRLAKFNGVREYFVLHLKECEWQRKRRPEELEKELCAWLLKY